MTHPFAKHLILFMAEFFACCLNVRSAEGAPADAPRAPLTIYANGLTRSGYSLEYLTWDTVYGGNAKRDGIKFHADPRVSREFAATASDYGGDDEDIFHHAPAADFGRLEHMKQTFWLTNASRGNRALNRGFWAHQIEATVRSMVRRNSELWVYTGGLMLPDEDGTITVETSGPHKVWKPTHYFKAVLLQEQDRKPSMIAWIVPNSEPPADAQIEDYQRYVDEVEFALGENLYSWLDEATQQRLESGR